MPSNIGRKLFGEIRSGVQEVVQEHIDDEISQIQAIDITKAAASMLDAGVEYKIIESLLCRYWNLRPSEAHRFIRDGEEERSFYSI